MKKLSLLLCVFFISGFLVFAGGGQQGETKSAAPQGPVTVVFWSNFSGALADTLTELINQYHKAQSKYVIQFEFQGNASDLMAKLAATSKDALPDMFSGAVEHTGLYAASDYCTPLQEFISKDRWDYSATYPHLITAYSDGKGNQIGYPLGNSFPGIYVNMDIFRKAGLDPYKELKSMQDVYRVAKLLVDGKYVKNGVAFHANGYYVNASLAVEGVDSVDASNGYGGRVTKCLYNEGNTYKALFGMLKAYQDIFAGGYGVPYGTDLNSEIVPMFSRGDLAMLVGVISIYSRIKMAGATFDIGMTTMPGCTVNSKSTGIPAGGTGNFIANNGKKASQEGAYDFIKWLAAPAQAAYWASHTGYLPVTSTAAATREYQEFIQVDFKRAQYCLDAQAKGDKTTRTPYLPIANEVLRANLLAIDQVSNDPKFNIDKAIKDATTSINESIELFNLANRK